MVVAVGPNVTRIQVIDDILIDKRKGCVDFEHGPPTESVVGTRLTCGVCVFAMRGSGGMLHLSGIHVVQRDIGLFGPRFTCRWLRLDGYKYKRRESYRGSRRDEPYFFLPSPPALLPPLLWVSLVGQIFSAKRSEYAVKPNIP